MKQLFFLFILCVFVSCENDEVSYSSEYLKELAPKMKNTIQIIAHGGASAYEPFNSIRSFKKAFELEADGIELDLMNTKDDSLMVFHNLNTKKITGADYNMVDTEAAVLRSLNIGKGEKIPYLSEVFKILPPGKKIYLEVKWYQVLTAKNNTRLIDKLVDQIEKSGRINDCIVVCFDIDYLLKIKEKKPELKLYWNTLDPSTVNMISDWLFIRNLNGCDVQSSLINYELAQKLKERNQMLFAWTINDEKLAIELYQKYKVNGIFTDKPDFIRGSLGIFFK